MRWLVVMLAVALAAGCSRLLTTNIGDIQRDSERYENRTVTIRGTVTAAIELPLTERALYQVEDRTGEIWVQSAAGAPDRGAEVTVTGTVRPQLEIGGRNFAVVIIERKREVR